MDPEERLQSVLTCISRWSLYIPCAISAASLAGWAAGSPVLTSFGFQYIPIAPSTALMFLLVSGPFVYYLDGRRSRARKHAAAAAAAAVFLVCLALLAAYLLGARFEAEHMGFPVMPRNFGDVPIGHMSPISSMTFIIASVSVMLRLFSRKEAGGYGRDASAFLGAAAALVGSVVVLGYAYETPLLYGGRIIPMAFPTAVASVFLGLGLATASGPTARAVAVFAGSSVRSRLMRVFLPAIIAILLIQNFLFKKVLESEGNPALLSALAAVLSVLIMSLLIGRISKRVGGEIDRVIAELRRTEESLRLSNERQRQMYEDREKIIIELKDALSSVKQLSGMLPICVSCKKIKDDKGYWEDVASYISLHSEALFSHGLCPECAEKAMNDLEILRKSGKARGDAKKR